MEYLTFNNVVMGVVALFGLIVFLSSWFTVDTQNVAVIQRFGKYVRCCQSGLNFKLPIIEQVAGWLTYRRQQSLLEVETKTEDNVFVKIHVVVQYSIIPKREYDAFYALQDTVGQIKAYVFDAVRARVPRMTLDKAFEAKDEIAHAVEHELSEAMASFGYRIEKALVTDINPDEKVKHSMNEINAAQRLRVAASENAQAAYIMKVKEAEAEAESKKLQGKGIADQRKAIIEGLKTSVHDFKEAVEGSTAKDIMTLVLMTQYFDTLHAIGAQSKTNTLIVPHSPGVLGDISSQIRDSILQSEAVKH